MSVGTREKVREKAFAAAESSIASTSSGSHSCSQEFQLPLSKRLAKMMIRNTTPLHEDLVCSGWPVHAGPKCFAYSPTQHRADALFRDRPTCAGTIAEFRPIVGRSD